MHLDAKEIELKKAVFDTFTAFRQAVHASHKGGFSVEVQLNHDDTGHVINNASDLNVSIEKVVRFSLEKRNGDDG